MKRQNWGYMQHGVVVWLTGSPELLSRRALRDGTASRPLLSQKNGEPLQAVSPWTIGSFLRVLTHHFAGLCKLKGLSNTS